MTEPTRIQPRTLKGFRDLLPEAAIAREKLVATAIDVYRSYGFSPIDTPALEYTEILLGKGGAETDKQLYRFDDAGGRDVAMRFDLTVPLARYAAQHIGRLGTPFKRYHVGPVWRGENTQFGRYREFVQCDFDTIGTESAVADIETALVVHDVFAALGFERFTVRANDRRVLNGVLERIGLAERSVEVLRAVDKLPKVGAARVADDLAAAGAEPGQVDAVLALSSLQGGNDTVLDGIRSLVAGSDQGEAGADALAGLVTGTAAAGVPPGRIQLDVSIARGLDYYTGMVLETFLEDLPGIGSCCSGGRYDDLASLYTSRRLPGVGASLGVDRLLAAMDELGMSDGAATWASVLVTLFDEESLPGALRMAAALRAAGIGAEVYPETRRLGTQLKYADRKGHRLALVAGPEERATGHVQVKYLTTGESRTVPEAELVATCEAALRT